MSFLFVAFSLNATSNDRNQYTSILRPSALEVTGVTNTDIPRVAVNGKPPNSGRPPGNGEPGGFAQWLDNIATTGTGSDGIGRWPQISILVGKNDKSHFTRTGRSYVRPSETGALGLTYDGQGNLIQDACWRYTWDGENRLVAMEMRADGGIPIVPTGMNPVKLTKVEFDYDALGRRIAKRVKQRTTALELWQTLSHTRFWYDGWNLIAETNAAGQLVRRYIWGTDLSGTPQGAGGVGGLLGIEVMRTTGRKLYLVCTEANGNVMGLIDGETGALAARFDYDPFGNQVTDWRATNLDADGICPFRFSTKYTDVETGLVYYGFRYYSPELGRWMSKDPIEEGGGMNLFGMIGNDAINSWDLLGLQTSASVGVTPPPYGSGRTPLAEDVTHALAAMFRKMGDPLGASGVEHYTFKGPEKMVLTKGDVESLSLQDDLYVFTHQKMAEAIDKVNKGEESLIEVKDADGKYHTKRGNGDNLLGSFTIWMNATVKCDIAGWKAEGTFRLEDDYDFDPKWLDYIKGNSSRSIKGQVATFVGSLIISGKPYKIESKEIKFTEEPKDGKRARWRTSDK